MNAPFNPAFRAVLCTFRAPFELTPAVDWQRPGRSLAEHAQAFQPALPFDFMVRGTICLNGRAVPRELWSRVRTRPPRPGQMLELSFHLPPLGGGGDGGGKQVLALLASIAVSVAAGWVVAGGLAKSFGMASLAAGTMAARLAGAGVALLGSLLVSALVPPPVARHQPAQARIRNEGAASASGNVLDPNGPIPRVLGSRKLFPPLACEPLTTFSGPDEVVEAVYALAGPHRLQDIRIGAANAIDIPGCELETREGWPGDDPLNIVRRQARTETLQAELRGHSTDAEDGARLDRTLDVAQALPQPQVVATREAPDEHQLQLVLPQGLSYQGKEDTPLRLPLRLRLRRRGDPGWRNLPELHFQAATPRQLRATIRLIWTDSAATPSAAGSEGWVEARIAAPDQSAAPSGGGWSADGAFAAAGGDAWLAAGNTGSSAVRHVEMDRFEARILLDPADWPPGRYEVEITRGAVVRAADYSASSYQVSGSVWALFGYRTPGAPAIPRARDGQTETLYLLRSVSIWSRAPVIPGDLALIAVRARNRALDAVSVLASGYVPDWDGSGWRGWHVTDNPAPHLRDILAGALNADPLPAAVLDDAGLLDWRSHCATQGYRVNAVIEGQSAAEAAALVAACGYARPVMSDLWGVAMDRDRSAEAPVQLFTPRNSADVSWRRAMPRLPDGLRVNFRDADLDYEARQVTVLAPGGSPGGILEQVDYEGPVTEAEVRARAAYDLAQPRLRGTDYSLRAPAEAIVCRRGSLVALQHDTLTTHGGSARVSWVGLAEDGRVARLGLDSEVDQQNRPGFAAITDLGAVGNLGLIGASSAVLLRRTDGTLGVHALAAGAEPDELVLDPPVTAAGIEPGVLASVGLAARETLRLIVKAIEPAADFHATLTLVDEAQELWA